MEEIKQETATETKAVDPLDNEEVNKAAYEFMQLSKQSKAYIKNMKGGALARVFSAVVEFPFNKETPRFRDKTENELFLMCLAMFQSKQVMSKALAENELEMKRLQNEAAQAVANEIIEESKGG